MPFTLTGQLTPIVIFNNVLGTLLGLFFLYQIVYTIVALFRGSVRLAPAKKNHSYAFVIAAHNEEPVIANLVASIRAQDYPSELVEVFVVADACTDDTARAAREAGAVVYERNDLARKGKSWVLDYAFDRILKEYPDRFEGFFVFDADNILAPDYITEMNKAFDAGHYVVTGYRNSKNFDTSWISSSYALHFLREAKFLNNARMLLGTSCTISGSGWLVSERIVRAMHGWDFHTLTEDLQFSTFCAFNRVRIAYAPAEFFDEQPVTFRASWTQRLRWSKGFLQVFFSYYRELLAAMRKGYFAAYDMFATVGPASLLTVLTVFANGIYLLVGWFSHGFLATDAEMAMCAASIIYSLGSMYFVFFVLGLLTVLTERDHIHTASMRKLLVAIFAYPVFMLSYIPINVVALFKKVEWVPTKHTMAMDFDDVVNRFNAQD